MNRSERRHHAQIDSSVLSFPWKSARIRLCEKDADLRAAASPLSSFCAPSIHGHGQGAAEDPLFLPFHEVSKEEYQEQKRKKDELQQGSGRTNGTAPKQYPPTIKLQNHRQHLRSLGEAIDDDTMSWVYCNLLVSKQEGEPTGCNKTPHGDDSSTKKVLHQSSPSKIKTEYHQPAKLNKAESTPVTHSSNTSRGGRGAPSLEYELPKDFTPRPWSVVVGRDKASLESHGSMRLRVVVSWYLERYKKSGDKVDKTQIISEIESTIESANGGSQGAFVKFHNGRWWQVDPWTAREKIGRRLRESLHAKYSSSSRRKRERHRIRRAKVNNNSNSNNNNTLDLDAPSTFSRISTASKC